MKLVLINRTRMLSLLVIAGRLVVGRTQDMEQNVYNSNEFSLVLSLPLHWRQVQHRQEEDDVLEEQEQLSMGSHSRQPVSSVPAKAVQGTETPSNFH